MVPAFCGEVVELCGCEVGVLFCVFAGKGDAFGGVGWYQSVFHSVSEDAGEDLVGVPFPGSC